MGWAGGLVELTCSALALEVASEGSPRIQGGFRSRFQVFATKHACVERASKLKQIERVKPETK